LVFISGFSVDHRVWIEVAERLKNSFQIILFDNRGAGQSEIPTGLYSVEQMAHDTAELCAQLGIKKAHFIGSSMGGFILQTLTHNYPDLVKSAIICNSATHIHTCFHIYVEAQLALIKAGAPREALIKASYAWAFSYRYLTTPGVLDALIEWGLCDPYPFSITGYEGQYAALNNFDSRSWVHEINTRVLVLTGDQDIIISPESAKLLAACIRDSKYYCFSECGHVPFMEYRDEFVRVVTNFISE